MRATEAGEMAAANEPDGPLKGVKVLDFTIYQNGPSATGRLAEMGVSSRQRRPCSAVFCVADVLELRCALTAAP